MAASKKNPRYIATIYAKALFSLANEENNLDAVMVEINQLSASLAASPELEAALQSKVISHSSYIKLVDGVANKLNLSKIVKNILRILADNNRLSLLKFMLDDFVVLYNAEKQIDQVELITVTKAQPEFVKDLANKISAKTGRKVEINNVIDSTIIGGLKITLNSVMIDASIKTKLEQIKNIGQSALSAI